MEPPDSLAPAEGYDRVRPPALRLLRAAGRAAERSGPACPAVVAQIHHLQSGAFGMAYLERDKATGEQVAIKYIPRGDTVRGQRRAAQLRALPQTLRFGGKAT